MTSGQSRRDFLKVTLAGGAAAATAGRWARAAMAAPAARRGAAPAAAAVASGPAKAKARVALTAGEDHADLAFKGLKMFEKEIAAAIGDKRVILKPNCVSIVRQEPSTHAKNLEGILEFLASIGKKNVVIAESCYGGSTLDGYSFLGFNPVAAKYGATLMDLDKEDFQVMPVFDQTSMRTKPCRFSKILLDPNSFIISAAKLKTHDRIVATLSLKNIVVGAAIKVGRVNDKPLTHGGGTYGTNVNLACLAPMLHPHLAVIDGFQGMEGDGNDTGTFVEHRVCVVSPDWLAADRVGVELMGIDFAKLGYLNFCAQANMGEANLEQIEVLGEAIKDHIKPYKLARNIDQQLQWMQAPPAVGRGG